MKSKSPQIILASSSPRRMHLLKMLLDNFGLKFKVIPSNISEEYKHSKSFSSYVQQLALDKALSVASKYNGIVIGADTIVVYNKKIMGKPNSKKEAVKFLKTLSNKVHTVYTGLAIINSLSKQIFVDYESTKVLFRKLDISEINKYVNSGVPMDKAGAYGIQDDYGSTFVKKINGDYFNVVGLPIVKTYLGLKHFLNLD